MDILQKTKQPLRQISEKILLNAGIFIFIVLMQCWSSLIGLSKYPVDKLLINLSIIILQATCITCILSVLPEAISRVLRKLIVLLASLFFFFEGITLVQNDMLYGYGVLLSITATTTQEGSAYLLGLNYGQLVLQIVIPYIIISSLILIIKNKKANIIYKIGGGI